MNSSGAPWKRDDCVCVCVCEYVCVCVCVCACVCVHVCMCGVHIMRGSVRIGNVLIIQGITAVSVLQAHMSSIAATLIVREQEFCSS